MTPTPDLFALAHAALAASTHSTEPQVQVWYCASARLALVEIEEKFQTIRRLVIARERELAAPKQLGIGDKP